MKYLMLVLLAAASIAHLWGSWDSNARRRYITKPMLLILILLYYIFSTNTYSALLITALLTSWLGDVLLMKKGNKWFVAGGISFMISHVFFIGVYVSNIDFRMVKLPVVIPAVAVYFTVCALIIRAIKDNTPKAMVFPMLFYLFCNSAMNVFALIQLESLRSVGAAAAYAGAVLFFISDCTLFLVRYHKNKKLIFRQHFTVMLTYILGEFLITHGMLLIG